MQEHAGMPMVLAFLKTSQEKAKYPASKTAKCILLCKFSRKEEASGERMRQAMQIKARISSYSSNPVYIREAIEFIQGEISSDRVGAAAFVVAKALNSRWARSELVEFSHLKKEISKAYEAAHSLRGAKLHAKEDFISRAKKGGLEPECIEHGASMFDLAMLRLEVLALLLEPNLAAK